MDHIVKKLSEIEHAAEAVVEHAELEKSELEERIQNERNQFDKQLEDHTQKELNDIHKGLNRQMDEILARQNRKNQTAIEELKRFEEKHTHMPRNCQTYHRGIAYGKFTCIQWHRNKSTRHAGETAH